MPKLDFKQLNLDVSAFVQFICTEQKKFAELVLISQGKLGYNDLVVLNQVISDCGNYFLQQSVLINNLASEEVAFGALIEMLSKVDNLLANAGQYQECRREHLVPKDVLTLVSGVEKFRNKFSGFLRELYV